MATDFIPINEMDTKELRKKLKLPLTKSIKYLCKENGIWKEKEVVDYEPIFSYSSGAQTLSIQLSTGEKKRIHSDYLADMQRGSFISDIEGENSSDKKSNTSKKDISNADKKESKQGNKIHGIPSEYVVLDIETTGVNHFQNEIIEIAAIRFRDDKEIERFSTLIRVKSKITSEIEKLTGITDELLSNEGIDKFTAIMSLNNFLGEAIVVGHNLASFDRAFLDDAYMDVLMCHFPNDYVDTLSLAKEQYKNLEHYSLEFLAKKFNIDYSKAHRAEEDCIINQIVYEYIKYGKKVSDEYEDYILKHIEDDKFDDNLEVIEENDMKGWKEIINDTLRELIIEMSLPTNSLKLLANIGKSTRVVTSYSICIYEPDLIEDSSSENMNKERNSIVMRITDLSKKGMADMLRIDSSNKYYFEPSIVPANANVYGQNRDLYMKVNWHSDEFQEYIRFCVRHAANNYSPKATSFACCSRYVNCSKVRKCIHKNLLFSKACEYRKNLEKGEVFY